MSLPNVLSAIRELVLESPILPDNENERKNLYLGRFPGLTEEEREDLAKIPAEKLELYSATVFTAESKIIRNHFKLTLLAVESCWEKAYHKEFNLLEFTKNLHKLRPWKSHHTQAFVNNVKDTFCYDYPKLVAIEPAVSDFARLEALTVGMKRFPDETSNRTPLSMPTLAAMTVEKLLNLQACASPTLRTIECSIDAAGCFMRFHGQGAFPAFPTQQKRHYSLGCRNQNNAVIWINIVPAVYSLFDQEQSFKLESLAKAYIKAYPNRREQEVFSIFMNSLNRLLSASALRLYPMQ